MKSTGVIRKVDELGRIVIPKEIRDRFQIEEGTDIEIYIQGNKIVLQKYETQECPLCHKNCDKEDRFCSGCGFEFDGQEE